MKSNSHKILEALEREGSFPTHSEARVKHIASTVPGWSGFNHYLFFKSVFAACDFKTVLMLGVYKGRDISFICDGAKDRELQIVGVDKFSDTPCADWPEDKKVMSWTEAGFPPSPTFDEAKANIERHASPKHQFRLIVSDDAPWLEAVQGSFDFIYVDTSHDRETVKRQLAQLKKLCAPHTVIAGDDYENIQPTWGVKEAVTYAFKTHHVLADCIWWANAEDML